MKTVFAAIAGVAIAGSAAASTPENLAIWTFETSVPITAGPHSAEGGTVGGNALGGHASGSAVYSNPVGNGSNESFSSNFWSTGDWYQFSTSTLGYTGISIMFDQTRSSTGPADFNVQWSTDGLAFFNLAAYNVTQVTWSSLPPGQVASTFGPFVGPGALDNQASVFFRLTQASPTGATAGTNRVDNIIISGKLVPTPGALALFGVAGLTALRRRRA